MKKKAGYVFALLLCAAAVLAVCLCAGCAPTPDDARIKAAILEALESEEDPPELDFDGMKVPARYSGKALVVIETLRPEEQRQPVRRYVIEYERASKTFRARLDDIGDAGDADGEASVG